MGRESAAGAGGRNRLAFVGTVVWRPAHTASVYKLLLIVFNNVVLFAFVLPCECNAPEGPAKDGAFCSCRVAQHLVCSNTWERKNKSALCPLLFYFLTPFPWLFDSTHMVIWKHGWTSTGGAGAAHGSSQPIPGTTEAPPAPLCPQPMPCRHPVHGYGLGCFSVAWTSCAGHSVNFPARPSSSGLRGFLESLWQNKESC